jgi:hypothetical protein
VLASNNLTYLTARPRLPADAAELGGLAGHVRAGRCALFVGAGLSAPAGLPTWGALMRRLVEAATPLAVDPALFGDGVDMDDHHHDLLGQPSLAPVRDALGRDQFDRLCRRIQRVRGSRLDLQVLYDALHVVYSDSTHRVELDRLSDARRYAEMAEHCRTRLGRERFHALVGQALTPRGSLPSTHQHIVRTPYACVVTTNFDNLLEQAYTRYAGFVPRAPTGAELGRQGTLLLDRAFYVLKAHGDAQRPDTMVFTADDYRRIIHETPAFQAVMGGILLTHAVLFVGYSLNDPNFRLLLDNQLTIFNGHVPPRYAVLEGVGDAEADLLWRTSKLQVLSYPPKQHEEVGRFLAALADESAAPDVRKPSRGAGRRREAHATLRVESDGTRVSYTLAFRAAGGLSEVFSSGPHPGTPDWGRLFREADRQAGRARSPRAAVRSVGRALARTLPDDLRHALRRRPAGEVLEIACSPAATRVPWEWIDDGAGALCARRPVIRRPVTISPEARGRRWVEMPLRALVIGDAGDAAQGALQHPLYFAELEARTIESLLGAAAPGVQVTRLSREAATHARVMHELESGRYDVIHFGGHAWFDDREAYFYVWDRIILGSELAPLLSKQTPALMVLNTHYTAFVMSEVETPMRDLAERRALGVAAFDSPRGFAEAAMRCGVSAFVGPFGTVADRPAAEFIVSFYDQLLRSVPVAEALLEARRTAGRAAQDCGLFYTCFGFPDFRLIERGRRPRARASLARVKRDAGWPND